MAYRKHEKDLLRFLRRRLGSAAAAEDIAHDLYLKLYRMPETEPPRDGRSYLFRMAANLATDHMRVEKRRSEIRAEMGHTLRTSEMVVTPERAALARAELAFLEAEASRLPARCRRIFYLSRYEGWSHVRIAEALGVGLTTVHKDLKLAMSTLLAARRRFHGQDPDSVG
ncbi:RNA polymerase sigma factor [Glycocaulis alkaliphilus]|uniref:RNA polymerase sigma factor n=1 Tax=Glycocaulis alkaliphilus TaxID=1434191 RepID=UPI001F28A043|nr:RNA polymerase sigma factor [Glycocaulis alkaliphilus]